MGRMRHYYQGFDDTKQQYREIFAQSREALAVRLVALSVDETEFVEPGQAFQLLSSWLAPKNPGTSEYAWQKRALHEVEHVIGLELVTRLQQIEAYKNTFSCHMCGMCCRLASSEYTYEQLQARAQAGDDFARQFTSIFLPYASRDEARQRFPDVVSAVLQEAGEPADAETEHVYFYHCPHVGPDNRCMLYGTDRRPAICGSYPETPLGFVYQKCAWKPWKDETHGDALLVHAMLALCTDLSQRLRQALGLPVAG